MKVNNLLFTVSHFWTSIKLVSVCVSPLWYICCVWWAELCPILHMFNDPTKRCAALAS